MKEKGAQPLENLKLNYFYKIIREGLALWKVNNGLKRGLS